MALDMFWKNVDAQLDHIEKVKPVTASHVIEIMNEYSSPSSGQAFFAGSGGDRQLLDSIRKAGWEVVRFQAIYYWVAQHPVTREKLTYIEGDVFEGDTMPADDDL